MRAFLPSRGRKPTAALMNCSSWSSWRRPANGPSRPFPKACNSALGWPRPSSIIRIIDEGLGQPNALLHAFGKGLDGPFAGRLQLDQLEQFINAAVGLRPRDGKNARIEPQEFFGGQKFVIVGQLGQITNALTRDRFAHVDAKQKGGASGGRNKAQQDVHGGGLAGAVRTQEAEDLTGANPQVEVLDRDLLPLPRVLRPTRPP